MLRTLTERRLYVPHLEFLELRELRHKPDGDTCSDRAEETGDGTEHDDECRDVLLGELLNSPREEELNERSDDTGHSRIGCKNYTRTKMHIRVRRRDK